MNKHAKDVNVAHLCLHKNLHKGLLLGGIVVIVGFKLEVHKADLWKRTRVGSSMGAGRKKYSVSNTRWEITHLGGARDPEVHSVLV